jgi:hypothetical protein
MTPGWILDIFAALMLTVAAVSAARIVVARPWQHGAVVADTDVAHLLMAIAMAGMLVSGLRTLPDAIWEVIFGALTAWFAYRVVRDARANGRALAGGHCAPHLVHSAAMLYMFCALVPPGGGQGMSGMGGSSGTQSLELPTLAFAFALILAGYTIWDLDQLSSRTRVLTSASFALPGAALPGAALPGAALPAAALPGAALAGVPASASGAETAGGVIAGSPAGARSRLLSPSMTVACRIAMGATMAFMLLIMV